MCTRRDVKEIVVRFIPIRPGKEIGVACKVGFRDCKVEASERCSVRLRAIVNRWVESIGDIGENRRLCRRIVTLDV